MVQLVLYFVHPLSPDSHRLPCPQAVIDIADQVSIRSRTALLVRFCPTVTVALDRQSEPLNFDPKTCAVAAAAVLMFSPDSCSSICPQANERPFCPRSDKLASLRPFHSQIIIVRVARLNWRVRFVMLLNNKMSKERNGVPLTCEILRKNTIELS